MPKKKQKLLSEWSCKSPLYIKKSDKRYARCLKQLKTRGFSDTETWALDSVIAKFILPRLIRFKEITNAYPGGEMTEEKWDAALDDMIFAFQWVILVNDNEVDYFKLSKKEESDNQKRHERGMKLFAEYFMNLGW